MTAHAAMKKLSSKPAEIPRGVRALGPNETDRQTMDIQPADEILGGEETGRESVGMPEDRDTWEYHCNVSKLNHEQVDCGALANLAMKRWIAKQRGYHHRISRLGHEEIDRDTMGILPRYQQTRPWGYHWGQQTQP